MPKRAPTPKPKLKILVSSSVYGFEELLESVYGLLEGYGYEVLMSHKGTIPVDPKISAMDNCLECVEKCDLFLGIILPGYGTGKESDKALSITHREILRAIELNLPRWFLVHEHVAVSRQLLQQFRDEKKEGFKLKAGMDFKKTSVLSDLRVLEMYEAATREEIPKVAKRTGNWLQKFNPDEDARLFVTAQFRRYRELEENHLSKLKDVGEIQKVIESKKKPTKPAQLTKKPKKSDKKGSDES
jgi:hypothetical protein